MLREIAAQKNKLDTDTLPFLGLMIQSISDPIQQGQASYSKQALYYGIQIGQSTSGQDILILHGYQVALNCQITYMAQKLTDVVHFAGRWLYRQREMQFKLGINGFSDGLMVRVTMDENLTIPEQDIGDTGNLYTMQANLMAVTYVGEIEVRPKLKGIKLTSGLASKDGKAIPSTVTTETITVKTKVA
jgi:hypothetical protein